MITLLRFRRLEEAVRQAGFGDNIDWTERLASPVDAEEFARAAIYVIANSGMKNSVAAPIYDRCIGALEQTTSNNGDDDGKHHRGKLRPRGPPRRADRPPQ